MGVTKENKGHVGSPRPGRRMLPHLLIPALLGWYLLESELPSWDSVFFRLTVPGVVVLALSKGQGSLLPLTIVEVSK